MAPRETGQAASPNAAWTEHEHITPAVQNEAQRLVEHTGTPELAKQAIDAAVPRKQPGASRKDGFARREGFVSYLELFEASTVVQTTDGKNWFITALPSNHSSGQKWLLWNEQELAAHSLHASFEEAQQQIAAGS